MGHYSWLGLEGILMNYVDFTGVTAQINPNQLLIMVRFQHLMIICYFPLAGLDIDIFFKEILFLGQKDLVKPHFTWFYILSNQSKQMGRM